MSKKRTRLWVAIRRYVSACNGTPDVPFSRAQLDAATKEIEKAIDDECKAAVNQALGEALNSGDGSYRP